MYINAINSTQKTDIINILIGFSILFICSQIYIPIQPIPITMQTVGVTIVGLMLGKKQAMLSIISYTLLGMLGLPVFAKFASGFGYILSAKGGYYLGFIAAIYVMTTLKEQLKTTDFINLAIIALIGNIAVFLIAIPYLAYFIGIKQAVAVGFVPFIIPGIFKAFSSAAIIKFLKRK